LLATERVGHLATADTHGRPHVVPVCFVYHAGRIYIALDEKPKRAPVTRLRRVRNLLANPAVALVVDRYAEDWSALSYVLVEGRASLLASGADYVAAVAQQPLIAIDIERLIFWQAQPPGATAAHEPPPTGQAIAEPESAT
jgi:PPOX class probable F420-dependent enzyme